MDTIRLFFEQNQPIIVFAYGLVFFIMGLAIALQSRQSSRLGLARSLAWLAAFGITLALFEWGELFSYVHEAYLSPAGIENLHRIHLLFLSIAFVCLMEFGVALLRPLQVGQWIHPITVSLLIFYALVCLVVLPRILPDPHIWHSTADALARYLFALPGGLLAAYGLREQTYRHIAPLDAPHIVNNLRTAGITLASYGFLAGLIVPPIPFFPGNWLNTVTFESFTGLPPLVFYTAIGLILAITIIRALEVFDVEMERRIERMEQQQILAAERERLARELHDRTIQTAYSAGLMIDSARKLAEPGSQVSTRLERAVTALDGVIQDLRYNLGELHPQPPEESLAESLRKIREDPRYRSLVNINLNLDLPQPDPLPPAQTVHILAIVGEALANIVRHAHATDVLITARQHDGRLTIKTEDNGTGLPKKHNPGYGLRNMEDRARLIGGRLEVSSERGKGTTVMLEVPVQEGASPKPPLN